jgi:hypothetical protein
MKKSLIVILLAGIFMLGLSIELIEPDGKPSTWQEFLDIRGEGIHHIAFLQEGTMGS